MINAKIIVIFELNKPLYGGPEKLILNNKNIRKMITNIKTI